MSSESDPSINWVRAWYAAPTRMLSANLSGRTLRQQIHLNAGGEQIRLHLTNRYGDDPVTLSSLSVGEISKNPRVLPDEHALNFGGQPTITLKPGDDAISDPVPMHVDPFSDLAITFYLAQGECLTGHLDARQLSPISGVGNMTNLPREASYFFYPLQTTAWWLISGIDVLPAHPLNAVVAFGSSTTDGFGSTLNENGRWPDHLARQLAAASGTRFMSVINAGIGANQLTSSEIPRASALRIPPFITGEAGIKRMNWDVLTQPGATDLIVQIGSNDLRLGVAASTIIEGLQQLSTQTRKTYRRVFGTIILPGGYSTAQAEQREIVNTWLRNHGHECFDAVFDFATPLQSPDDASMLNPLYDWGDGIHPNDEGYCLMAEAVDINQLTGSPS